MASLLLFSPCLCKTKVIVTCNFALQMLSIISVSSLPVDWALDIPCLLSLFLSVLYASSEVCPECMLGGLEVGEDHSLIVLAKRELNPLFSF